MNKKIIINNNLDYQKFLKKLNFYKYMYLTDYNIENNINKKELDIIIKALSIKKRKERIAYLYDEGAKYIDKYYSEDLCQFKDNKCFLQRKRNDGSKYGCCRYCKYVISNKGCPTSNISCKMIYCKEALKNIKKLKLSDIDFFKCFSIFQRIILKIDYCSTRDQVINDLYYGPIYWLIRSIKKGIDVQIKSSKIKKGIE